MKRQLSLLPFFLIFLFLLSCSPAPILRLSPLAQDTRWIWGKEYATSAANEIEVAAAFESMDENLIAFDVEVTNWSAQPVVVSPERFYYLPLTSPQDTVNLAAAKQVGFALDPETKILDLDKEISRENASYAAIAGADAIGGLLNLILDIATIGTEKTEEEIKEEEQRRRDDEIARQTREITHENSLANLKNEKIKWESTTLRRTTLDPEQSARGRVYFRVNDKTQYLKLCFPIGEANVQIIFEQKRIKV